MQETLRFFDPGTGPGTDSSSARNDEGRSAGWWSYGRSKLSRNLSEHSTLSLTGQFNRTVGKNKGDYETTFAGAGAPPDERISFTSPFRAAWGQAGAAYQSQVDKNYDLEASLYWNRTTNTDNSAFSGGSSLQSIASRRAVDSLRFDSKYEKTLGAGGRSDGWSPCGDDPRRQ